VLVDRDAAAATAIRANLDATGFADVARLLRVMVSSFVGRGAPEAPFDLVFLDPPYDVTSPEVADVLAGLAAGDLVAAGGTVVVERPRSGEPLVLPGASGIEKERPYGDTLLVVAHAG
jgi:16S rRNA (guanine966-N2)-methyltransferase